MNKPWALVTGASSGIGEAFAFALAKRGEFHLILTARRKERLEANALECRTTLDCQGRTDIRVEVIAADLSLPIERIRLVSEVQTLTPTLGLLINNAGFGTVTDLYRSAVERQLEMVEVNCKAPLDLILRFGSGVQSIVNVSSVVAFGPIPGMATYAASKAFLLSLSVALSEENRENGRKVIAVCPGLTESEFHIVSGLDKKLDVVKSMTAEEVVQQALDALQRGDQIVVTGLINKLSVITSRLAGLRLHARIARLVLSRHRKNHLRNAPTDLP